MHVIARVVDLELCLVDSANGFDRTQQSPLADPQESAGDNIEKADPMLLLVDLHVADEANGLAINREHGAAAEVFDRAGDQALRLPEWDKAYRRFSSHAVRLCRGSCNANE
jgi:hypothetical protein